MKDHLARYTLRIDRTCLKKFRYIAESHGRSANKQLEMYMKEVVKQYEEKNGKIDFDNQ